MATSRFKIWFAGEDGVRAGFTQGRTEDVSLLLSLLGPSRACPRRSVRNRASPHWSCLLTLFACAERPLGSAECLLFQVLSCLRTMACGLPFYARRGWHPPSQKGTNKTTTDDCTCKLANLGDGTGASQLSMASLVGHLGDYHSGPGATACDRGGGAARLRSWNADRRHAPLHRPWPTCLLRQSIFRRALFPTGYVPDTAAVCDSRKEATGNL